MNKSIVNKQREIKRIFNILNENDIYEEYDIFIFTFIDWCNTAYRYSESLKLNNKKVFSIKIFTKSCNIYFPSEIPHIYNNYNNKFYKKNLIFKTISYNAPLFYLSFKNKIIENKIINIMNKSKTIYFHAETLLDIPSFDFTKKNVIYGCSGNYYRNEPEKFIHTVYNEKINQHLLLQCPDLLGYNNKIHEELVYYGVDTNLIKFRERTFENKLIISHYATNHLSKGTKNILEAINRILEEFPDKFEYIGIKNESFKERVKNESYQTDWIKNIDRMSKAHIYIETCNLEINGKKFGEWGNTCLEASATGCIVLTNSLTKKYYEKEYTKDYPLLISNSTQEIYNNLKKLAYYTPEQLKSLSLKYREWVVNNHSLDKTGKRFIKKFNI